MIRLPIHLENQKMIYMSNNNVEHSEIEKSLNQSTMLLEYFELNKRNITARQYTYYEIPQFYTFNATVKRWTPRKSHFNVIGRLYNINPSQKELFHLRLLLLRVKGATSFKDLRTVNGRTYDSYVETCIALHLIETDDEWDKALEEAC